jgi:hypothetical protein
MICNIALTRLPESAMNRTLLAPVAALLLLPVQALAAHPLVTDDTGTQGAQRYQLEVTGEVGRDRVSSGGVETTERAGQMAVGLAIGVLDEVDLLVAAPQAWTRVREGGAVVFDESGVGDIGVELKWRVLERGGFSLAVKPGVSFPTGDERRGLGNGRMSYGAFLIASQSAGPFTFHANAGYARNEFELAADRAANRADCFHGSLAAAAEVTDGLQLVADVAVERNPDRTATTWPAHALGGAIYSLSDRLDVDVGVKVAINEPATNVVGLAGMAWRF